MIMSQTWMRKEAKGSFENVIWQFLTNPGFFWIFRPCTFCYFSRAIQASTAEALQGVPVPFRAFVSPPHLRPPRVHQACPAFPQAVSFW